MGVGEVVARGLSFIRWDLDRLVEQVRSVCEIDENGCWIWRYGDFKPDCSYYPQIMIKRRKQSVARWVLEVTTGTGGEVARHRCDRMPCCCPDHLLWGSQADNVMDRVVRGRTAVGERNGFRTHPELFRGENHWMRRFPERIRRGADNPRTGKAMPAFYGDNNPARQHPGLLARGEAHGMAKLNDAAVQEIRSRSSQGTSAYRLAREFGVAKTTITAVIRRKTWRHLP